MGELPDPAPGPGEVRIRVMVCAVNYPDVLICEDKYQFKPTRPFAPGAEVAGYIDAVGDGVTSLQPGTRVLASGIHGGLAELFIGKADRCFPIPDSMPFEDAAALMVTYGTSLYARLRSA